MLLIRKNIFCNRKKNFSKTDYGNKPNFCQWHRNLFPQFIRLYTTCTNENHSDTGFEKLCKALYDNLQEKLTMFIPLPWSWSVHLIHFSYGAVMGIKVHGSWTFPSCPTPTLVSWIIWFEIKDGHWGRWVCLKTQVDLALIGKDL